MTELHLEDEATAVLQELHAQLLLLWSKLMNERGEHRDLVLYIRKALNDFLIAVAVFLQILAQTG